jgi:hypothetical protein
MLCDVATWADTSFNQAIKDLGRRRCGYSNLGKPLVIKSGVVARTLPEIPFPDILRPEQKVALCAASKIDRLLLGVRNAHFRLFHFINLFFSNSFALWLQ